MQPKAKLNILQTKMAYEAELIYRQQMASFKPTFPNPLLHVDDDHDLDDFILTPKTAQKQCMANIDRRPKKLLSSNLPSINNSFENSSVLNPLANSTRLNVTLTSDTRSPKRIITSNPAVIGQQSFHRTPIKLNKTSEYNINQNLSTTLSIKHQQLLESTQIEITDHFFKDYTGNISDIPLPIDKPAPITNTIQHKENITEVSIFNSQATEDISFYTSFYIPPIISTADIQHQYNNHVVCNTPPKSPLHTCYSLKPRQPGFKLHRISIDNSNSDNSVICRNCCVDINFNKLLIIANRMPKGRQTFCAECLLLISSRPKDKNVDFFNQQH